MDAVHGGEEPVFGAQFFERAGGLVGEGDVVAPFFLGDGHAVFHHVPVDEFDVGIAFFGFEDAAAQFDLEGTGGQGFGGIPGGPDLEFFLVGVGECGEREVERLAVVAADFGLAGGDGDDVGLDGAALFVGEGERLGSGVGERQQMGPREGGCEEQGAVAGRRWHWRKRES